MFTLLALDRVESAQALGREVLTHVRDRDGPVLAAWVRDPLALAGARDGRSDSDARRMFRGVSRVAPRA